MSSDPTPKRPGLSPAAPLELATLVAYAPDAVVSRTLQRGKAGSLTVFAFDEGQALSEHTAPFDAHVIVLEGTVDLTIGGQPVRAEAGEIVLMPADVPHGLRAATSFKMLLVMLRARSGEE